MLGIKAFICAVFGVICAILGGRFLSDHRRRDEPDVVSRRVRAKEALDIARGAVDAETDSGAREGEEDAADGNSAASAAAGASTSRALSKRGSGWRGGPAPKSEARDD